MSGNTETTKQHLLGNSEFSLGHVTIFKEMSEKLEI